MLLSTIQTSFVLTMDVFFDIIYRKKEVFTMAQTKMTIRMDTDIKQQAQELFAKFGLDMTTAINIFLNQAVMEQSIPFKIHIPKNQEK